MTNWRSIVLTGASSGIGAALAERLAAPGTKLLLVGRNHARLEAVAAQVTARGGMAEIAAIDVTNRDLLADRLSAFDDAHPVDLVIANAGISSGLNAERNEEPSDIARKVIETNLVGMLNTVETLVAPMIARGSGQLALMSSLAGVRPFADMPSYSAAKAGVRAWGIAARGWLKPHGIRVSVICPGFVTSPMSARHVGPKPFEVSAEAAAEKIVRALSRRKAMIAFPWPMVVLLWLGNLVPPTISDFFERRFAARIEPGEDQQP